MWDRITLIFAILCEAICIICLGSMGYRQYTAMQRLQDNPNIRVMNRQRLINKFIVHGVEGVEISDEFIESSTIDDVRKMFLANRLFFTRCTFPRQSIDEISSLRQIDHIVLISCQADSARVICAVSRLPNLRILSMARMNIENTACFKQLPKSMKQLVFYKSHLSDGVIESLGGLRGLRYLSLRNATFNPGELSALCLCEDLEHIALSNTIVNDNDILPLHHCKKLNQLDLVNTRVSTNILMILKNFKNLKTVSLSESVVSLEACSAILGPDVKIQLDADSTE